MILFCINQTDWIQLLKVSLKLRHLEKYVWKLLSLNLVEFLIFYIRFSFKFNIQGYTHRMPLHVLQLYMQNCTTVQLYNCTCTTVQLYMYNCTIVHVQLYNCTTVQLYMYNYTTVELQNCSTVQLYNCTTVTINLILSLLNY